MDQPQLIYFADPMCSWCWGFAPVIEAIDAAWGDRLPIRLVMGGLRPGTAEVMSEAAKATLRGHWREVTAASGQPFGPSGLDEAGFIYDTDPAARAVVLARRRHPAGALPYLQALQRAFYAEGRNITEPAVLADVAAVAGVWDDGFAEALADETVKQETWRDYATSRGAGVSGFPTLIIGPRSDGAYEAVTRGFRPADEVLPGIAGRLAAAV
jgi:putative protein-disulfide isomerase